MNFLEEIYQEKILDVISPLMQNIGENKDRILRKSKKSPFLDAF